MADVAAALAMLRDHRGISVRDAARALGIPHTTLGGYLTGRHAPPVGILKKLLHLLEVTDSSIVEAWHAAVLRVRRRPGRRPADAPVPYRGLACFRPEDADWYFGRETLVDLALERLAARFRQGDAMLVVVGPSGVGKSSLLRAGLIPAIGSGRLAVPGSQDWPVRLHTPGDQPLIELGAHVDPVEGRPGLVVVDQLEQLLVNASGQDQAAYVEQLAEVARSGHGAVILALRADLVGNALSDPTLARALQDGQVVMAAMAENELRRAIVEPARRAKTDLEAGLVEVMLSEVAPPMRLPTDRSGAHEPGALPLLAHALLTTWEAGDRRRLTVAAYRDVGGLRGAVAGTAEAVFGGLDPADQQRARWLLTRLVRVSGDGVDTRRRATYADLTHAENPDESDALGEVLETFIASRLVTADADTVDISHEALLWAWPRLRDWLNEDRAHLLVGQHVDDAARTWAQEKEDPALLYRGVRLATAREWLGAGHGAGLTDLARHYLDLSIRRERRSLRLLYNTVAALVGLLLVAVGAVVVAADQRGAALAQQRIATEERDRAISRLVATRADRIRTKDTSLSMQLSLAAYQIAPTPEARSALLDSSATFAGTRLLGSTGVMQTIAVSPDRRTLAAGTSDRSLLIWDVASRTRLASVADAAGDVIYGVAYSPDGTIVAAGSGDHHVGLWNLTDPRQPVRLANLDMGTGVIYAVAFSRDGTILHAGSGDGAVHRWDVSVPDRPTALTPLTNGGGPVQALAVGPSGHLLAAANADNTIQIWDIRDASRPAATSPRLTGPSRSLLAVAFSPDETALAAGGKDGSVHVWQTADPTHPIKMNHVLPGTSGWVNAVTFSPDGTTLAAAMSGTLLLWDWRKALITATLPHPAPVTSVSYVDAGVVATAAADGTARMWPLPGPILSGDGLTINNVRFSADSAHIAAAAGDTRIWDTTTRAPAGPPITNPAGSSTALALTPDGRTLVVSDRVGQLHLWNVTDPAHPTPRGAPVPAHQALIEQIALSPDGTLLATAGDDNAVQLWDLSDPERPRRVADLAGFTKLVYWVVFSPNGNLVAAASVDNTVRIWDVRDPANPTEVTEPLTSSQAYALSVAFSPDGNTIAVGSADKAIYLWDATDPRHPRRSGEPLVGPTNYVYALAFSPDGHTLAAANTDSTLWLWDLTDRTRPDVLATLAVATGALYTVAFNNDGSKLAAAGAGKLVWLWDTDITRVTEHICATAGDPITESEWRQFVPTLAYQPPCRT